MRNRLGRLAEEESAGLDADERARIVAEVGRVGPGLVRSAHRRRVAVRVGGAAAVVAGVGLLWVVAQPPVDTCDTWAPVAAGAIQGTTSLGRRGRVEADAGTVARVSGAACRTTIALESGRVTVHADDLGGGRLAVQTDEGEVEVKGTVFSVAADERAVTVEVAEGRVVWTARGAGPVFLGASERVVVERAVAAVDEPEASEEVAPDFADAPEAVAPHGADAPEAVAPDAARAEEDVAPLPRKRRRRRRRRQPRSAEVAPQPPAETVSSEALVRRAEALRRTGNVSGARAAYRAAGEVGDRTAEAAWIALAQYELELGRPRATLTALRRRARMFASGTLEQEAEWIAVRALAASGQSGRARTKAEQIQRRWPGSPQASAAKAWLESKP
ncbi:MAG: FecR domain-containing protein [Deltaproteobacteria bacterium]